MKRWKLLVLPLGVVFVGFVLFPAYRAIANHRDLQETLLWMTQTYNPHKGGDNFGQGHGWGIHYVRRGNDEEITDKFNTTFTHDGGCNTVIRDEVFAVGVFIETPSVSTYKFNLRDIDPDSIEVKSYDSHADGFSCADPEQVKVWQLNCDSAEIVFLTRNSAPAINEDSVTTFTNLTGSDHESRGVSKTNHGWLLVDEVPYAQRLAKALKHAVELCGGKKSIF
jgi:hypothetical protein